MAFGARKGEGLATKCTEDLLGTHCVQKLEGGRVKLGNRISSLVLVNRLGH